LASKTGTPSIIPASIERTQPSIQFTSLQFENRVSVTQKVKRNILCGGYGWSQTFTKECFEVKFGHGYALRLCKCIYHIKPNLGKTMQENKAKPMNFKLKMRNRNYIMSGGLVLLAGVAQTNKEPWLYHRARRRWR
jgi:hypothetical protein